MVRSIPRYQKEKRRHSKRNRFILLVPPVEKPIITSQWFINDKTGTSTRLRNILPRRPKTWPVISKSGAALKPLIAGMLCGTLLLFAGVYTTTANAFNITVQNQEALTTAYNVYYEGYNIGIVRDEAMVQQIIDGIKQEFKELYGMDVVLEPDIRLEEVLVESCFLSDIKDIKRVIGANAGVKVKAAILVIDGKEMAFLKNEAEIKQVLDRIKEPYIPSKEGSNNSIENVGFEENVKIEMRPVDFSRVESPEEVYDRLTGGHHQKKIYTVKEGDSLWAIAEKSGITVGDILKANPLLDEDDTLKVGMELNLEVPESLLNVVVTEIVRYVDTIPYETETRKDDSMYTTQTKIVQQGQQGQKQIVARVYKYNGIEKEREIISQEVIKDPVKKIVVKGTKAPTRYLTTSRGSGSIIWPAAGRLTSPFGQRWGRLHAGIDIANSKGTPIYAAEGGVVTFSGWSSGYGILVKINHGKGVETRYGHMSSRVVKVGQEVQKGQLIGYMGNTGRSTGPHLHFEIRINGTPVNPIKYLR